MAFSDTGRGDRNEDLQAPDRAWGEPQGAFRRADYERQSEADNPPQLELGDDDVRLPWLEGEDDEFEDRSGSIGQGMLLAVLGLLALIVIAGGVFWVVRGNSDQQLVADGGVITAPDEPFKTRPDDPGGEIVEGTGDTSFAVAEGQSRQPRIRESEEVPGPGFQTVSGSDDKPSGAVPAAAAPAEEAVSGVGVQVGAYANRESAQAGWNTLTMQYPELAGVRHRIVEGKADIGVVYRLQAVPGDLAAAKELCSGMKSAGLSCQVKK